MGQTPAGQDPDVPSAGNIAADHKLSHHPSIPVPVVIGNRLFDLLLGDLLFQFVQDPVTAGELNQQG